MFSTLLQRPGHMLQLNYLDAITISLPVAKMNTQTTDSAQAADSSTVRAKHKSRLLTDLALSLGLVFIFMGVAYWKSIDPTSLPWLKHDYRSHLGAEYDCIAQAIRQGRGFSDPFQIETGPTTWMPPVLPYVMAGLYWFHGDNRSMVVVWMVALQGVSTWLASFIMLRASRGRRQMVAGVIIIVAFYSTNFYQLFQQTHDTGLLLFVISLLWLGLSKQSAPSLHHQPLHHQPPPHQPERVSVRFPSVCLSTHRNQIFWGAWGAFCTLCSPVIGGAWFVLTFWPARPRQRKWRELNCWLVVFGVWTLLISPWMIRNYVEFGKWFPIKPNGMYELWQSHCKDEDGILDSQSGSGHPWSSGGEQRARYKEIGEIAFIAEKGAEVQKSIRDNPLGLLERIVNRGIAALVYYTPFSMLEEYHAGGWPVFMSHCVHPLPFVAILVVVSLGSIPIERNIFITIALFGLLLLPYILVSYYDRYAAMLVGLKMLLVLYGWDALVLALCPREIPNHVHV